MATASKLRSLFSLTSRRRHGRRGLPSSAFNRISALADELLSLPDPAPDPTPLMESHLFPSLLRSSRNDPSASIELLSLLRPRPLLALEVFNWRRKIAIGPDAIPLFSEEYSKAIAIAGRARDLELACALFYEAVATLPKTALYNSLMAAYMYNGKMRPCLAVFESLKQDRRCRPTIVTYNILLSLFGRSLLVCMRLHHPEG